MYCSNCNLEFDSKFCPECGTKLVERVIMYCPNCNTEHDSKFCPDCGAKIVQKNAGGGAASIVSNSSCYSKLPMDKIQAAANASYPKESLKSLAIAALKIAEVIEERLPNADVSYMVHPSEFDSSVNPDALPVHFLFMKDGVPKVAVVAVTENGYNATHVLETANACLNNGIGYVRVYADGSYGDWIQGWRCTWSRWKKEPVSQETINFCKDWLVGKINNYLCNVE